MICPKHMSVPVVHIRFSLLWILVLLVIHVMCICREECIPTYLHRYISVCKLLHHVSA